MKKEKRMQPKQIIKWAKGRKVDYITYVHYQGQDVMTIMFEGGTGLDIRPFHNERGLVLGNHVIFEKVKTNGEQNPAKQTS